MSGSHTTDGSLAVTAGCSSENPVTLVALGGGEVTMHFFFSLGFGFCSDIARETG